MQIVYGYRIKYITATVPIATAHHICEPKSIPMKTNLQLLIFFFVLLLISGIYLYFAHTEMSWLPGIIFSILFSLFFISGCGSIIQAFLDYADRRIIIYARRLGPLKDGKRSAVFGSIEPLDKPLTTPLSGEPCVAYDYRIYHPHPDEPGTIVSIKKEARYGHGTSNIMIDDFTGWALTSSVIDSASGKIGLLGFPDLGIWRWQDQIDYERASEYIRQTTFERSSPDNIASLGDDVDAFISDTSGMMREDIRHSEADDAEGLLLDERFVPAGAYICAIGKYSAEHNGLLQDHGRGLRIIPGDSEEVSENLRTWSWKRIFLGLIMLLLSYAFLLPMIGGDTDDIGDEERYEYATSGYRVAYNILEEGYSGWSFDIGCFLFALVGVGLIWVVRKLVKNDYRILALITPFVIVVFSVVLGTVGLISGLNEYNKSREMLRDGQTSYVEGVVRYFSSGKNYESFEVNGIEFSYDYNTVNAGFRQTKNHGGPIDKGVYVRIWHDRGTILRLEVAKSR